MRSDYHKYPPIEPDIRQWPVYRLSQDRDHFIRQMRTSVFNQLTANQTKSVKALVDRALYMERSRIKDNPWKVDPPDERLFWSKVRKRMASAVEEDNHETEYDVLQEIIHRYAREIVGTFQINTFLFARRFLTFFFSRLLNTLKAGSLFGNRYQLHDQLNVVGEFEMVRSLMKKGTVIIVPTHSSNLDSILIGYMLDAILGLPSFSYGAGLNLYNTGYIAYFMNRLGAYRVDRRKKNLIYLETLKSFSRLSIERKVNSRSFPGVTRSRSGQIEPKLKIGLLSTAVEAQRSNFQKGQEDKIFIVPLNVSYHFVLEANSLIHQHLRQEGKEKYITSSRDDSYSIRKNIKFIWKLFRNTSQITFSFSRPMDVLGNLVDQDGVSYDQQQRPIHVREYFRLGEEITADLQRESQYSKHLAERIVQCLYADNVVLSSHFVAYLAFEILRNEHPGMDVFGIIQLPEEEYTFDWDSLVNGGRELQQALIHYRNQEKVRLSDILLQDIEELLADGIKNIGIFHAEKPLYQDKKGKVRSQSFKLLYFYHNRLEGYQLEDKVQWNRLQLSIAD